MGLREQLKARRKMTSVDFGTEDNLFVKTMSGLERADILDMSAMIDEDDKGRKTSRKNALYIAVTLCDESGDCIYSIDDLDEILELESDDIDTLVNMALEVNKLTEKTQEGQEKN